MREPQRNLCARDAAEPISAPRTSALEVNIFISVGSFIIVRLVRLEGDGAVLADRLIHVRHVRDEHE